MRRTTKQWQQIIADFKQSGLSAEHFRKLHNLPSSSFYKNRARYLAAPPSQDSGKAKASDKQNNFFELSTLQSKRIAREPSIRITRNDGMVVEVFL